MKDKIGLYHRHCCDCVLDLIFIVMVLSTAITLVIVEPLGAAVEFGRQLVTMFLKDLDDFPGKLLGVLVSLCNFSIFSIPPSVTLSGQVFCPLGLESFPCAEVKASAHLQCMASVSG